MIPKILHFIWLGPKTLPEQWMATWEKKNPNIKIKLWTEKEFISSFDIKNKELFYKYYVAGEFHGASDVVRIEILERYGGIYVDIDSICKESIEEEDFMKTDFFVGYEYQQTHPGRIANGVIGSIPGHPILKEYIKRMGETKKIRPIWNTIGGTMLTSIVENYGKNRITILPTCAFYPKNWNGMEAPIEGKIYAEQLWGTTNKLYK